LEPLQSFWLSADACKAAPDCKAFEDAAPFSFLMASVLVLVFGPGKLSLDALFGRGSGAAK